MNTIQVAFAIGLAALAGLVIRALIGKPFQYKTLSLRTRYPNFADAATSHFVLPQE